MTDILETLKPNMVFYHDYRSRSSNDWSDNNQDANIVSTSHFTGNGLKAPIDTDTITIPYDTSHQITNGTIISGWHYLQSNDVHRYLGNDLTGYYFLYFGPSNILQFYSSVTSSVIAHTADGCKCMYAVSFSDGNKPKFYKNDTYLGEGNVSQTVGITTSQIFIANGIPGVQFSLLFDKVLSDTEIASVYNRMLELDKGWPTIPLLRYKDTSDKTNFKTDFGINESVLNVTSDFLENTQMKIYNGTWKVERDTIEGIDCKIIRNKSDGLITLQSLGVLGHTPDEVTYGEWEFWIYKPTGGYFIIGFGNNPTLIETANSWYVKWDNSDDKIKLVSFATGTLIQTSSAISVNNWHKVKVTRDVSNNWELLVDDVSAGTANSAAITSTPYFHINCSINSALSWSCLNGTHSFIKTKL